MYMSRLKSTLDGNQRVLRILREELCKYLLSWYNFLLMLAGQHPKLTHSNSEGASPGFSKQDTKDGMRFIPNSV